MAMSEESQKSSYLAQCKKEEEFRSCLDNMYDIAHANVQELIKNPEDMAFHESQRQGRKRYMAGEDKELTKRLERKRQREQTAERYRQRCNQETISNRSGIEMSS